LHIAIQNQSLDMVKLLLEHKADPTLSSMTDNTPLDLAVLSNNIGIFHLIIEQNVNINAKQNFNATRCIEQGKSNHPEMLEILINKGIDIFDTDNVGNNIFHLVIQSLESNNFRIIDILLKHGVDINALNNQKRTPIEALALGLNGLDKKDVAWCAKNIKYFIEKGAKLPENKISFFEYLVDQNLMDLSDKINSISEALKFIKESPLKIGQLKHFALPNLEQELKTLEDIKREESSKIIGIIKSISKQDLELITKDDNLFWLQQMTPTINIPAMLSTLTKISSIYSVNKSLDINDPAPLFINLLENSIPNSVTTLQVLCVEAILKHLHDGYQFNLVGGEIQRDKDGNARALPYLEVITQYLGSPTLERLDQQEVFLIAADEDS
jgi:ankyrin repeat protein